MYEVVADPRDWAVSGLGKGTVVLGEGTGSKGEEVVTCTLVPVRTGMVGCPSWLLEPVEVREAVSPRSRCKVRLKSLS